MCRRRSDVNAQTSLTNAPPCTLGCCRARRSKSSIRLPQSSVWAQGARELRALPGSHRNEVSEPVVDGRIDDHMHAIAVTVVVDAMRVA